MGVAFSKRHMFSTSSRFSKTDRPVSSVNDVGKVAVSAEIVTCHVSLSFDAMEHRKNNNNHALHSSILRVPLLGIHLWRLGRKFPSTSSI